ncbi:MAG: PH domain-containing protein [Roseimicrobium sp.]
MSNTNLPNAASSAPEPLLWKGHTSQWVHFWFYFFCVLLAAGCLAGIPFTAGLSAAGVAVPLLMWVIRWWMTRTTVYELTTQRLRRRSGILDRKLDELELFRVKDYTMEQPFLLRMLGLGNLTLVTSDATTPTVPIRAIANVEEVREMLRQAVQSERDRKRVRELDVDSGGDVLTA